MKWHSAAKLSFQTILNSQEIINRTNNLLHNFEYKWHNTQNYEIDKFFTETNEIINYTAKLCLPLSKIRDTRKRTKNCAKKINGLIKAVKRPKKMRNQLLKI